MSPFGYLPPEPTGTALEQKEQQVTAAILARTVTPAPTSGVLPAIWCIECGTHLAESPTKPCPACAPDPKDVPLLERTSIPGERLPPVPNSCYPIGATPLEESA